MGQYHGGYPWFCTLWALLPIRDLARNFLRAYATYSRQIRVCLETYSFHHSLTHTDNSSIITFCTHCRYIRFTSFTKSINFIRWIAIKDNTCQQSHVFIFIQWVAIKDNILHHISNNSSNSLYYCQVGLMHNLFSFQGFLPLQSLNSFCFVSGSWHLFCLWA